MQVIIVGVVDVAAVVVVVDVFSLEGVGGDEGSELVVL